MLWLSDGPAPRGLWARLRADHAQSGLWPLLLGDNNIALRRNPNPRYRIPELFRPWETGELYPHAMSSPEAHDPDALPAGWWARHIAPLESMGQSADAAGWPAVVAPFGRSRPGPAAAKQPRTDPDWQAEQVADELNIEYPWMRLGLIATDRSADAPCIVGWYGAVNKIGDSGQISAVLRDWERRFATRVAGADFGTLYLSVAAPPEDEREALSVAAEHFALCPDNVWQRLLPFGQAAEISGYADELVASPSRSFWWDQDAF